MNKNRVVQPYGWNKRIVLMVGLGVWLGSVVHVFAASEPGPCSASQETHLLDYWLGDWTITNSHSGSSTSNVSLELEKCLFVEHWKNEKGHRAEMRFGYNPEEKNWSGMFADNEGRVHIFSSGKVAAGSAEFRGLSHGPKGEAILNKLTVVRLAPNRLEEAWEKSSDDGASWTTAYRAEYSRAQP